LPFALQTIPKLATQHPQLVYVWKKLPFDVELSNRNSLSNGAFFFCFYEKNSMAGFFKIQLLSMLKNK
jgi:hypothetical protein